MDSAKRNRRIYVAVCGFLMLAGCSNSVTAPSGAVIGTFGGHRVQLVAERSSVSVNLGCDWIRTESPLVPDPEGRFVLAAKPLALGRNATVTLRGAVETSRVTFEVIVIDASGTSTTQHSVTRGQPADFSKVICALTGS